MTNGDRVKQARELRGFTQTELAERIGVNQSAIAQIENEGFNPTREVLEGIVIQTGFPVAFFKQNSFTEFPLGSLLYRAKTSINLREKYEASQYGRTIFEIFQKMEEHVDTIPIQVPCLNDEPQVSAKVTRSLMGISPDTPIKNLINLIEKKGVLVFALPKSLEKRDAYSVWAGKNTNRPIIVIANKNSGDRLRFSIAHELAHLVMHKNNLKGNIAKFDKEADQFAGEFLMPEKAMENEITTPVTLMSLAKLKVRWGVSIQALIMRARDLEIINYRQHRYLFQKLSAKGWRIREPENLDIPIEKPRALRKITELLYGIPIDYKTFAHEMKLSAQFLKQVIDAHALHPELEKNISLPKVNNSKKIFPIKKYIQR